ncbi:hypothetical protein IEQ34_012461 [Dendrobium chrysotoxum]|uniref:Uncharacterized protein n=1 Tax=Dendrobium chrysotoxum TaxID=161865 RepID=A0AAV7GVP9_DENCH|nr:hypothetical protein IEQ34_012461 [Dendrobium chrysotoxum]
MWIVEFGVLDAARAATGETVATPDSGLEWTVDAEFRTQHGSRNRECNSASNKSLAISCLGLINNNLEASRVCLSSSHFVVAVRLRCFVGGVEIAHVASLAPSWLCDSACDFAPSTTFPSCQIGS